MPVKRQQTVAEISVLLHPSFTDCWFVWLFISQLFMEIVVARLQTKKRVSESRTKRQP